MIEIKPGPELDRAVAEAIGDKPGLPFSIARAESGQEGFTYKPYSTDLNAAFAAAEKVCDCGFAMHTAGKPVGGWQAFRCIVGIGWDIDRCERQIEVEAPTPALAICAAILKLKENDDG